MDSLISLVGAGLVVFVLHDMFHTIWHPSGQGSLTRLVIQVVWRGSRLVRKRGEQSSVIGPIAMLGVIMTWTLVIIAGWTLIYWPHMAEGFSFGSGLEPSQRRDFVDSLYLSLVTVATLGYGDIVPTYGWLRLAAPVEAFIGFALLTAAVSWVLQIYPALARRRTLAIRLALLQKADAARAIPGLDSSAASTLLDSLAGELIKVRVDLTQYAETYYFREKDAQASLPAQLGYLEEIARAAGSSARADVRLAGKVLGEAVEDYASLLGKQFVRGAEGPEQTLQRYAADHGHSRG